MPRPTATSTPEQEVGPYYIPDELLRSDIAEGRPGVPLELRLGLLDSRSCQPLANAAVDVWHCDALGLSYSGFTEQSLRGGGPGGPGGRGFGGPAGPGGRGCGGPPPDGEMGPPPVNRPTDKQTFCRGIQISDRSGIVTFKTMFPGFYQGRTNHIHFKVRLDGEAAERTYKAGHTSHTGQISLTKTPASS